MNACEAMALGGKLTIDTSVVKGGHEVEIAISDSGPGITPEVMAHVFDPFFTTKEKGTGLGLSVVYGIIERHGGRIDLTSEAGQGDPGGHPAPGARRRGAQGMMRHGCPLTPPSPPVGERGGLSTAHAPGRGHGRRGADLPLVDR